MSTVTTVKGPRTAAATESVATLILLDGKNLLTTQGTRPDNQGQPNTTAISRINGMNALDTGTLYAN